MLMQTTQQTKLAQVVFLLKHHADPNAQDTRGFTALHRAAYLGHRTSRRLDGPLAGPHPDEQRIRDKASR